MQPSAQTAPAPTRTEVHGAGRRPTGADAGPAEQLRKAPSGRPAVIAACAGAMAAAWPAIGLLPAGLAEYLVPDTPRNALAAHTTLGAFVAVASVAVVVVALSGLARVPSGSALVLTFCGRYCGTVRRTGLVWTNPLHLRRRVDVRVHHWRSDDVQATDREGVPLRASLLVTWQVRDTARACLSTTEHTAYLRNVVEAAASRAFSALPCDRFLQDGPSLRADSGLGDELTRTVADGAGAVGIEVLSVQVVRLGYAPEVADAVRRRQLAVLEAKDREAVLDQVAGTVEAATARLTRSDAVEWDAYERKRFVRELTLALYATRTAAPVPPVAKADE